MIHVILLLNVMSWVVFGLPSQGTCCGLTQPRGRMTSSPDQTRVLPLCGNADTILEYWMSMGDYTSHQVGSRLELFQFVNMLQIGG